MKDLIGRESEIKILQNALESKSAELIAIYGRRRVGKTFLVRKVYEKHLVFELTGIKNATLNEQLQNFNYTLKNALNSVIDPSVPKNWLAAFDVLKTYLSSLSSKKNRVVFFDELPWLNTPKSGFLSAFDHFWNSWGSKQEKLTVIICGSAASWMIRNIVNDKGGLHNRITQRIRLMPFNLTETEKHLRHRKIILDRYQIIQLYMVTGGIPLYLNYIQQGESAVQAIDRICFTKDGPLRKEFKNLYQSLFDIPDRHITIVKDLANKPSGMTRNELILKNQIPSGGGLTGLLDELIESGFIYEYYPFGKKAKDKIYKLGDEYSLFYLKFIDNSKATGFGTWQIKSNSSSWRSWSGLAFENICLKHILQIKKGLGISGIFTESSIWRSSSTNEKNGAQIDLLLDRSDNCINIIEIKFSRSEYIIDKKYSEVLLNKQEIFCQSVKTNKTIFLTILSTFGVKKNEYYINLIQNQLTMNDLFDS